MAAEQEQGPQTAVVGVVGTVGRKKEIDANRNRETRPKALTLKGKQWQGAGGSRDVRKL